MTKFYKLLQISLLPLIFIKIIMIKSTKEHRFLHLHHDGREKYYGY